jgi:tetratricopeptide (TPR) repeat protein
MKCWYASWVAIIIAIGFAPDPAQADPASGVLSSIEDEIDSLLLSEARVRFDLINSDLRDTPRGKYLSGKLRFYEGDYDGALVDLRKAIEGARTEIDWKTLRDRVELSSDVAAGLVSTVGKRSSFVFRHDAGIDALLVAHADDALFKQVKALEEAWGDRPPKGMEIILLPDMESLSAYCGLTVEQMERTGTVGISKYGKVMILSPRVIATGYPWLDTLAHELTHVLITRLSRNKAPIWLHEGIAKIMERRWRDQKIGDLTPEEAYLLDRAARERRLIPFRRFHPSVAHLRNQEDAQLAYAQVLSFIRYVDDRVDEPGWIGKLLNELGRGRTADDAFTKVAKFNVRRLYLWWEQAAGGKRQTPAVAVDLMKRRFLRGAVTDRVGAESVLSDDVRRHVRLGDLLRLRGHVEPAIIEYRRAQALAQTYTPEITDRLGGCLLDIGDFEKVVQTLEPMAHLYPNHATVFVQLGKALTSLKRYKEAANMLEKAVAVNPFHPEVHCLAAKCYRALAADGKAALGEEQCRMLAAR